MAGGTRAEPETALTYDEGVPREIVLSCFGECGEPLPAWLRPVDPAKEAMDALWQDIMKNEGIADEARRRAMWSDPVLLQDLKRWRTFVDTEQFERLAGQGRALVKQGRASGDSAMERRARRSVTGVYVSEPLAAEFDIALYPSTPDSPSLACGPCLGAGAQ